MEKMRKMQMVKKALRFMRHEIRSRIVRSGVPGGPPRELDFALGVPFAYEPDLSENPRVGVVLHLFYPELTEEFAPILLNMGLTLSVMVTTDTEEKRAKILELFAQHELRDVEVMQVENRGRDAGALLTGFRDRYHDFDLLLVLHSKVTPQASIGAGWRQTLVSGLVGSRAVVRSILAIFEAEPQVGLVFCQHYEPIRKWTGWEMNFPAAQRVASNWGLQLNRRGELDFPSGAMFWIRPAALNPVLELGLKSDDFPPGSETFDGSVSHAIERLYALAAEYAGYSWYKVAAPDCYSYRETIRTPKSEAELRSFLIDRRRSVMASMVRKSR